MSGRKVVVVGGGVVGASLCYELARRGAADVMLLEKEHPGAGATGVSFAWLTSQAQFRAAGDITVGQARDYFLFHRLAHGGWRRMQHDTGHDLGVRWCGTVEWERPGEGDDSRLAVERDRRIRWGAMTRPVDAAEIERLVPGAVPGPVGTAIHTADDGCVDPRVAVEALLDAARAAGATVRHGCAVTGFEEKGSRVVALHTSAGTVECDDVVVTAGVDTPALMRQVGVEVPLIDSVGAIVHLEPMPQVLGPIVYAPSVHVLQRPDGRLVLARHYSGVAPAQPSADVDVDALLTDAAEYLPALTGAKVEKVTRGRRILPADGLPIVGRSPRFPNVRCLATNAGISLGPLFAQLLTTELLDEAEIDLLADYRASRFSTQAS